MVRWDGVTGHSVTLSDHLKDCAGDFVESANSKA